MKITKKLQQAEHEGRVWWSFEYFPPRTAPGMQNLLDRIERMRELGPEFIDITWNAGGRTSELTSELVRCCQRDLGIETCMHLTCTNMPAAKVDIALKEAKQWGCRNVLALRGDPPFGQEQWTKTEDGFEHGIDLVKHIRAGYGDYFDVAVAGFPEAHNRHDREDEMKFLKNKIDAGVDFIFTQMFWDVDLFIDWVKAVRAAGITCPIVPGIMPIQTWNGFQRATSLAKISTPPALLAALEPYKNDDEKVREIGTQIVADMCRKILAADIGIRGLHFYTMNLERGTRMLLEALNFVPHIEVVRPLPWRQALTPTRRGENIRPIFWANRVKSYIHRTENWDEYPNGRFGDSRSPAYGELDGYGIWIKQTPEEGRQIWGAPQTFNDITELFSKFCLGQLKALPWSDTAPASETTIISTELAKLNDHGYLTINSQPAVNGAKSTDPVHGWGPRNGYVYQKAYLEFFCDKTKFEELVSRIERDPMITYYAIDKHGNLRTNNHSDGPNAVTWGVFAGKEIIQPTIVEAVSFLAWKDEAFELGMQWASIYEPGSVSRKLIESMMETFYLVNIVHNDFQNPQAIFGSFGTETKKVVGAVNGNGLSHAILN
ncbi:methylenetetrahydrofolate reduct [Dacryopinax primogenitus]|uniref:Methylenetetrahydrofolate reduct n=1 Tax=Dacryopinax primogenitus (strain DJM 731) TaxID=1858805 RepID=M5G436_DACPD|nr:methylenetetrahydrofolate reduct [Dacryopinax primogenitus]EJU03439.1 methylenetetrahydrofolate reduct [Dacryopinax primogenitus]